MTRYIYKTIILCVLVTLFAGCRARQQVIRSATHVADKTPSELMHDIIANHFPYQSFSARLNVSLSTGGRSLSTRANARILHDDILQVTVQMPILGVTMFRLYVEPQSVTIIDVMNRRYVHESIASLQEIFPVGFDFYTLQALFTNALFVPGSRHVEVRDYRHFDIVLTNDLQYFMRGHDRRSGIEYSFIVNGYDRVTQADIVHEDSFLRWSYFNFAMAGQHAFPHRMNIEMATATQRATAEMTFSNIAINESFQITPTVPDGFTRASVADVMRMITVLL